MLRLLRRRASPPTAMPGVATVAANETIDARAVVGRLGQRASGLGRDAAEVRGVIDDSTKAARGQAEQLRQLAQGLAEVSQAQSRIDADAAGTLQAAQGAREAVAALGNEVSAIVETLHQVAEAAAGITQIALQTRLVAFNASVEAKRAGEAGRGFGVVADAVKDLAGRVESSSKLIMGTVTTLESRIDVLAREASLPGGGSGAKGAVHQALQGVEGAVERIAQASRQGLARCQELDERMQGAENSMQRTAGTLEAALGRTESLLQLSEQMIETVADSGIETEDTPYIAAVQGAAGRIAALLEQALQQGRIGEAALFDTRYQAIEGTAPQQHLAGFTALADELFPQVQEELLGFSPKVVFCIATDRNGYVACHNRQYSQPQRPGDLAWNTAHCRNRRIFDDRTGLASGRNTRPFLLQTYRRDMGGGNFVVMKEAAAPITVRGRHWGGLRLAFKF